MTTDLPGPRPPRRTFVVRVLATYATLALSAGAAVFTAVMLFRTETPVADTVVVGAPRPPSFTDSEVVAAKQKACGAWNSASAAIAQSSNAVPDSAHGNWDDPVTREAMATEARTTLVETAYLRGQLGPATPPELVRPIHDYLLATFDQEDATVRRMGTEVDAAVGRSNSAVDKVNAVCGVK